MLSFRNRLLILLTGLVVGAQTVTFVTALARTRATEQQRADSQLIAGAQVARRMIDYRERQLANAVSVLTADYGLREAVASGDTPTVASALGNHADASWRGTDRGLRSRRACDRHGRGHRSDRCRGGEGTRASWRA